MHFHKIHNDDLGPARLFNCTIRDSEELRTECIELNPFEELHYNSKGNPVSPLLRYDENGFWGWLPNQKTWWPLRNSKIKLALNNINEVKVKYYDD